MTTNVQSAVADAAGEQRLDRLAGGVTVADGDRDSRTVRAPFTDEVVGSVPECVEADVALAVERAREAQSSWAERSPAERAEVLLDYHDLVLDEQATLLDLVQLESGKARRDAFEEVLDVALTARYYGQRAEQYLGPDDRRGALPGLTKTTVHRKPVGVVGVISPWNYPLTLAVSDAMPALLAGNAVVLEPAEQTPLAALRAAELLREAGLPEGLFQVVTGDGATLGPPLVEAVDFLQFTGSTETGRVVAEQAAGRLVGSSMELGGKNPMVVLDDADLDRAVEGAVHGCYTNAGQLCISFERLYVESGVHDEFLDRFVDRTRELTVDAGFDWGVEVGSLVSAEQLEKVESHVADAKAKGVTVEVGGQPRPEVGPHFYAPTVLTGVTRAMTLSREETFGPVVAVHEVDDAEEAVARANDSEYGLNGSVWTGDAERGRDLARRIDCGTVNVNDAYAAAWASIDAPMGGMKQSGLGRRHGEHGISKFTESQTVAVQRGPPVGDPGPVPANWYAKGMTLAMRAMKRLGRYGLV